MNAIPIAAIFTLLFFPGAAFSQAASSASEVGSIEGFKAVWMTENGALPRITYNCGDGEKLPPISLSNVPVGTDEIEIAFFDDTYRGTKGWSHGVITFRVSRAEVTNRTYTIPSIESHTTELGPNAVITRNPDNGRYKGWHPPCNGMNRYSADITAKGATIKQTTSLKLN
jgi:hypothetical protein